MAVTIRVKFQHAGVTKKVLLHANASIKLCWSSFRKRIQRSPAWMASLSSIETKMAIPSESTPTLLSRWQWREFPVLVGLWNLHWHFPLQHLLSNHLLESGGSEVDDHHVSYSLEGPAATEVAADIPMAGMGGQPQVVVSVIGVVGQPFSLVGRWRIGCFGFKGNQAQTHSELSAAAVWRAYKTYWTDGPCQHQSRRNLSRFFQMRRSGRAFWKRRWTKFMVHWWVVPFWRDCKAT